MNSHLRRGPALRCKVDEGKGRVAHCASMPACLITLLHFANSCAMTASNGAGAGVCAAVSMPRPLNLAMSSVQRGPAVLALALKQMWLGGLTPWGAAGFGRSRGAQ